MPAPPSALQLHVWGPAFGLPSIDPDCLGVVAYFSLALPADAWSLVATSPCAISRPLPALRDASGRWLASGFAEIVEHVRRRGLGANLDDGLTPLEAADTTAYGAFLQAEAAPLLALSLYTSSANWSTAVRPAYSRLLPFPLTWIEPPAVRAEQSRAAAHLGFSSLDTDDDDADAGFSSLSAAAMHVFPGRSASRPSTATSVVSAVSSAFLPEDRAQIRLDETARAFFVVLTERRAAKKFLLRNDRPSSLDCLAFGYLALMALPDVPRPFLRDALRRHGSGLTAFLQDMRQLALAGRPAPLPWTDAPAPDARPLWLATVHGLVRSTPGLLGNWLAWLYALAGSDVARARRQLAAALAGTVVAVGLVLRYRSLPPFGTPVLLYSRVPTSFVGLGAAGSFLSAF